ncbi:MAG: hypothetical protein IJ071_04255 [Ruminococcus sp.]|nr:hypothetical protein [Ruminococcus sp.]
MKQNIIFALLLGAVLLLGFFSAGVASLLTEDPSGAVTEVPRTAGAAGVVYLSGSETGFDPMGDLHIFDGNALNTGFVSAKQRSVATAVAQALSSFGDSGQIDDDAAYDLNKAWALSRDGYIYANGWSYTDTAGNARLLDCIIDPIDCSVVYIRFWHEEEEQELSAQDVNRALDRFAEETTAFRYDYELFEQRMDQAYEKYYAEAGYENNGDIYEVASYPLISPSDRKSMAESLRVRCSLIRSLAEEITDSPLTLYWTYALGISTVEIDGFGQPGGIYDLIYTFIGTDDQPAKSYSVYKGRIYQTITVGRQKLITIFNITENCVEGFYAEK